MSGPTPGQRKRRRDGRESNQLRPLAADFGVLSAADGSARLAMGDTRVLAGVYGPRPVRSQRAEDPERAILDFSVVPASGVPSA
jgi:exosome complex component RRP41